MSSASLNSPTSQARRRDRVRNRLVPSPPYLADNIPQDMFSLELDLRTYDEQQNPNDWHNSLTIETIHAFTLAINHLFPNCLV
jgi:hypothetical protein